MFDSLLFQDINHQSQFLPNDDPIFQDLDLDDLFTKVNQLTGYDIRKTNHQPLTNDSEIRYRQETFKDLQKEQVYQAFENFTKRMLYNFQQHTELHKLNPQPYCEHNLVHLLDTEFEAIDILLSKLGTQSLCSSGLNKFIAYLRKYQNSDKTKAIKNKISIINRDFNNIYYRLYLNGRTVTVESLPKHKESMNNNFKETFSPIFESIQDMDSSVKMENDRSTYNMNNLQISIINELYKLYPQQFLELDDFYNQYFQYHDQLIENTVKELTFFLAWQKLEKTITKQTNLSFTLPILTNNDSEKVTDSFDLNLVLKLMQKTDHPQIITNQFNLNPNKPFLIISGPNQGGKTTYARMVGQIFYLARLGIAIAGTSAKIKTRQNIFTHFDRQESSNQLNGLLESDVNRMYQIIKKADSHSFVILNELFSSTSEEDATELGNRILKELDQKHITGIYVTFLESLGKNPRVQTLMSQVTSNATRTFKVIPEDLNGKAYTDILLKKYHLGQSDIEGELLK